MIVPYITYADNEITNIVLYSENKLFPYCRYLTTQLKRKTLRELRKAIKLNKVDYQMIPYLNRLNKIKGICSQFCCIGHSYREVPCNGNLVVFVDADVDTILKYKYREIQSWYECVGITTGICNYVVRWMFDMRHNKHKSYYKEFLEKLIKLLRMELYK